MMSLQRRIALKLVTSVIGLAKDLLLISQDGVGSLNVRLSVASGVEIEQALVVAGILTVDQTLVANVPAVDLLMSKVMERSETLGTGNEKVP